MLVEFHNKISKKKEDLIADVIGFGALLLFPKQYVHINIAMCDLGDVYGDCMDEEDDEYTIRLNRHLSEETLIITLLHELVHVWQYTKGLVFDNESDYFDRWQEIEAHGLEGTLYDRYRATTPA